MLQILIYIDLKHYDLAKKNLEHVFDIAKTNKYDKSEITIFNIIKEIITTENPKNYLKKLRETIEEKAVSLINLDKDVVVFWLDKRA